MQSGINNRNSVDNKGKLTNQLNFENRRLSSGRSTKPRRNFTPEPPPPVLIPRKKTTTKRTEDISNSYVEYVPMSRLEFLELLSSLPIQQFRLPFDYFEKVESTENDVDNNSCATIDDELFLFQNDMVLNENHDDDDENEINDEDLIPIRHCEKMKFKTNILFKDTLVNFFIIRRDF